MTVDALLMNAAMDDHRRQIEAGARYAGYDVPARAGAASLAKLRRSSGGHVEVPEVIADLIVAQI